MLHLGSSIVYYCIIMLGFPREYSQIQDSCYRRDDLLWSNEGFAILALLFLLTSSIFFMFCFYRAKKHKELFKKEVERLQKTNDGLKRDKKSLNEEVERLRKTNDGLEMDKESLNEQIEALEKRRDQLEFVLSKSEEGRNALNELEQIMQTPKALKEKIVEIQQRCDRLKEKLDNISNSVEENSKEEENLDYNVVEAQSSRITPELGTLADIDC